jgi:uncharacterized membrane protein YdjX (TVP38/TMEM64 family)
MENRKPETQTIQKKYASLIKKPETIWLILFATTPLLVGSALSFWAIEEKESLVMMDFWGWFLLFSLLSLPLTFSLIPNTLAGIVGGYLIGMWALPGMMVSFFLAALMGYALSRKMDSGLREEIYRIWPASEKAIKSMEGSSFYVVLTFRLLPVPPFAIGNLLLAWLKVPLSSFLIGSFLGMLPRMALMVWIGANAENILEMVKHPMRVPEIQGFTVIAIVIAIAIGWMKLRPGTLK